MKQFPHIFRNIFRINLIIRFLVILTVIGTSFIFFVKHNKSNLFDEVNSLEKLLKNEPGNANLHLQMAFFWNKK